MNMILIFLVFSIIFILAGMDSKNRYLSLSGSVLLLIISLTLLSTPLTSSDGFLINQTSDTTFSITQNYTVVNSFLTQAFNLSLLLISLALIFYSINDLRKKREEKLSNDENY